MMARYGVLNPQAVQSLLDSGTEVRPFPDDVLDAARTASCELFDEFASSDSDFQAVYEEASGQDLSEFFDIWLRQPTKPTSW